MKVSELYNGKGTVYSLEVFPPKGGDYTKVYDLVDELREGGSGLDPAFISITCGAMGRSTDAGTLEIARRIKSDYNLEPVVHLPCIGKSREEIDEYLLKLRELDITNVLALRGDPPKDYVGEVSVKDFTYASDLVTYIRERSDVGIGVAGYPEGHMDCLGPDGKPDLEADLLHLKWKEEAGAEYVVTQMFFDSELFFDFVRRARGIGITVPIIPGVMVIKSINQVAFVQGSLNIAMPKVLRSAVEERKGDKEELRSYLIGYTIDMCRELVAGGAGVEAAPGIQLFTMDDIPATVEIMKGLRAG